MPPERKPEETLVRMRPGDTVEIDGVEIRVEEIRAGRQVWIVVRPIDKVSTID